VQIFDTYYTTLKYRFHCNMNFIHMYYQSIKFMLKGVIVFYFIPTDFDLTEKNSLIILFAQGFNH